MNRRIIRDPIEPRGFLGGVLVFLAVLAVCALLSVDDVEGERPQTTEAR